ncbi:hypothetical protein chiPu_0012890 [Chiloscyllium punctatum]|uniref:Uncharacterized protein n=1 Tax=Chiloscyllium punctatum TaxID=137246 RepID=A0A401SVI5_CHIPU|nr:hypothetical protein [Chiloscyllium punctatum]
MDFENTIVGTFVDHSCEARICRARPQTSRDLVGLVQRAGAAEGPRAAAVPLKEAPPPPNRFYLNGSSGLRARESKAIVAARGSEGR